jgi:glutathione S-transferase
MMHELNLEYETKSVDISGGENKTEAFLSLNPSGKLPVLVDDGFVLFESFAINHYLAEKYQPALAGKDLTERALVMQWNCWTLANLADPFMTLILQFYRKTPDNDDIFAAKAAIARFLPVLDRVLAGKKYLVNDTFTVADLNLCSTIDNQEMSGIDLTAYPNIASWMTELKTRPALMAVFASN